MIKNRVWIIIFSAVFVISVAVGLWVYFSGNGTYANIYSDGKCVYSIDLSAVDKPYEIRVNSGDGYNVILVERGRICVKESNCGDKTCVNTGWTDSGAVPVICLPHKLVIRIEKKGAELFDAVSK
ncbi:MAG: NusG domain II-containing protein [Clostridia bacterium]|nr:NusG domain II-containing protein [Clostridia bacterium]